MPLAFVENVFAMGVAVLVRESRGIANITKSEPLVSIHDISYCIAKSWNIEVGEGAYGTLLVIRMASDYMVLVLQKTAM